MTAPVLQAAGLRKTFPVPGARGAPAGNRRRSAVTAVDDVSFELPRGGSLGIVGESGSGKTTVARILVGLLRPDAGTVLVDGVTRGGCRQGLRLGRRAERLRRARQVQMVFQDPYLSLDPRLSVTDCLDEVLRLHVPGDAAARRARLRELLDQVGIGSREATARPRELSGGQRQRVAIARALAVRPQVLVLDEAVTALDVSIQAQILNLLADIRADSAVSYVFVGHDLAVVRQVTDEVLVMYRGRVVERGATGTVLGGPTHPYTELLLASIPRPGWDPERIPALRRDIERREERTS